jgi:hypothetical protein
MNDIGAEVRREIQQWLESVVVGLDLCPFAARPLRAGTLRIQVSEAATELELLTELQLELQRLEDASQDQLETTLLVLPNMLSDFTEYNDFLDAVDELLEKFEWAGDYQVASFHPQYQFAGTEPDDAENLTNRSPYPLLHLLRESSVETALENYPDADQIPQNNIHTMQQLESSKRLKLFGYLDRNSGDVASAKQDDSTTTMETQKFGKS